ncbi:MAG TPA: MFS transporter, partial [Chitinophagales bacterium]|nr:MFS transporter [Chitinophagales bacterium]
KDGIDNINTIWLSVTVLLAFVVKCFYTTPFNAMINEVATDEKERLHIVMMLSIAYALGIGIGQTINLFLSMFEGVVPNETIFQICLLAYSIIALILMLMPVLFVPDNSGKNISTQEINYDKKHEGIFDNMLEVWNDKNYRILLIVELIYWFPQKIFVAAVPYFVATLFKLDNVYTTIILYCVGVVSLFLYPIIDKLVEKYGKKKIMQSALMCLVVAFIFTATIGMYELPTIAFVILYIIFNTYPAAVLGILPMALAGDNADHNFKETGIAKNASYFALKTFMMKVGVAITSLIFPSLLLLGNTPENPFGVRMVAVACTIASILAVLMMRKYKDVN